MSWAFRNHFSDKELQKIQRSNSAFQTKSMWNTGMTSEEYKHQRLLNENEKINKKLKTKYRKKKKENYYECDDEEDDEATIARWKMIQYS